MTNLYLGECARNFPVYFIEQQLATWTECTDNNIIVYIYLKINKNKQQINWQPMIGTKNGLSMRTRLQSPSCGPWLQGDVWSSVLWLHCISHDECRRHDFVLASSRINWAALSAIIIVGAWVLAEVMDGMTEASTTLSDLMPWTL